MLAPPSGGRRSRIGSAFDLERSPIPREHRNDTERFPPTVLPLARVDPRPWTAIIHTGGRSRPHQCQVVAIDDNSMIIRLTETVDLPAQLRIQLKTDGALIDALLVWTQNQEAGLLFTLSGAVRAALNE